jgi:hypothetical protein
MGKKIYEHNYQDGMATQNELLKEKITQKINQHNRGINAERAKFDIARLMQQQMSNLRKGVTTVVLFMALLSIGIVGCKKYDDDPTPPPIERELITQDLKLTNIYSMPMTKGFDPTTWVYEYNTNAYTLTFTSVNNPAETVTKNVTIAELQAGISVTLFAGTYNITYQTAHSTTNFTKCDIKINMTNVQIVGSPIALSATYDDYLIIVDMPNMLNVNVVNWVNYTMSFTLKDGFYYAYSNINDPAYTLRVVFTDMTNKPFDLGGKTLGHIYWYTTPLGATTNITFPAWIIDKITL